MGGGNAALCAAISAAANGARVTLLERAPEALAGGNSRFTAGAMRVVYEGVDDLVKLMPELTEGELARTDFGRYGAAEFYDDLGRVTHYRVDPALAETLVERSFETLAWMHDEGVRFLPLYGRQSFEVDGRVRFWGGLTVEAWGGGEGLVESLTAIARRRGVIVRYGIRARSLIHEDGRIRGVVADAGTGPEPFHADAVVLACGGFESSATWRARYLGPGWDLARVRGTRFNTGDGIQMALDIGAAARGHWSGCHAVAWDLPTRPSTAIWPWATASRSTPIRFGILVNNRTASVFSTRAPTSGTTPTPSTVPRCSPSPSRRPGRSSTPRCCPCYETSTASGR